MENIDLDRLVRDVIETYPDWQPPRVEIHIDGVLPTVSGKMRRFSPKTVSNLLSNAVKFVASQVQPRIKNLGESFPEHVHLWFEDNGVGIDAANHTRVFRMFERIFPASEFEGTGIGLTIVRKAVERMEGGSGSNRNWEKEADSGWCSRRE